LVEIWKRAKAPPPPPPKRGRGVVSRENGGGYFEVNWGW